MMKKRYGKPVMCVEEFEPNESVAACITATVACRIPTSANRPKNDQYGMPHGLCYNAATINFTDTSGSGYEVVNGVVDKNRPITVSPIPTELGTNNSATWTSVDNANGTGTYHHIGIMTVTAIDSNRPNHS